tara:strand:+ start:15785 stop:16969 length:1185 start_codon:yes stop_codon:yes gene_type:complete
LKTLLFDIAITGHHAEYISHLVDFLFQEGTAGEEYIFVVNPYFEQEFPGIVEKAGKIKGVTWVHIDEEAYKNVVSAGTVRRYFREYRLMDAYAKKLRPDHVFALSFNLVQLGAALFRTQYSFSGILFLHYYRMNRNTASEKFQYHKAYYLSKLFTKNPKLKTIFLLNDQEVVDETNKHLKTTAFKMLPDPIPRLHPREGFDIRKAYNIDPDRKIILHIGSLGNRKSSPETVQAATKIKASLQDKIALLLVGMATVPAERKLLKSTITVSTASSKAQIVWDEQFVPSDVMKSLFDQCDAVLIPYKNVEASSGILGHAAFAKKPVVATGSGLLKELVEQYNLGVLLQAPTASGIATGIERVITEPPLHSQADKFIKQHSPHNFAAMVLKDHLDINS